MLLALHCTGIGGLVQGHLSKYAESSHCKTHYSKLSEVFAVARCGARVNVSPFINNKNVQRDRGAPRLFGNRRHNPYLILLSPSRW
jgi:hypothetical protein